MQHSRRPSPRLMGLAAFCAALFAWMIIGFVLPFRAVSGGRELLATRVGGYDAADVIDMLQFLRAHPDAAAIQHAVYTTGPAFILPAALAALLFLLMRRMLQPGDSFFGRPIPAIMISTLSLFPIVYGLADYGEVLCGMLLFPPAVPSEQMVALLPTVMPILVRLKFLAFIVSVILLIRVAATAREHDVD